MAFATDELLLSLAPGLAKPGIVEFWVSAAADTTYKIAIAAEQYSYAAVGKTVGEIRDELFGEIVAPDIAPIVAAPKAEDRIKVTGTPGDPFEFWALPFDKIKAIEVQKASGPSTARRLLILEATSLLVPADVWGKKQVWGHAYLTLFFLKKMENIESNGTDGQASSLALGPASLSLTTPAEADLLADPSGYGSLYLTYYNSLVAGPIWS
ncbi:MAG TPA: hypothetical protein P5234_14405 [Thermoanaerobaculaceae bacterium]|nr:hypothetical protein [Thermoanaerobaculaceae bacterium]